jgi:hypothetical protein
VAEAFPVLFQSNPSATTLTDVYTVPALTSIVLSSFVVCNRGAATSFRWSVAVNGAANDNSQYLCYDTAINANETQTYTLGVTLDAADVVRVYATLATLTFSGFGVTIT